MKLPIDSPVNAKSSVEEIAGWIAELSRQHERHSTEPDVVAAIHLAAKEAARLLDDATGEMPPRWPASEAPSTRPTEL